MPLEAGDPGPSASHAGRGAASGSPPRPGPPRSPSPARSSGQECPARPVGAAHESDSRAYELTWLMQAAMSLCVSASEFVLPLRRHLRSSTWFFSAPPFCWLCIGSQKKSLSLLPPPFAEPSIPATSANSHPRSHSTVPKSAPKDSPHTASGEPGPPRRRRRSCRGAA